MFPRCSKGPPWRARVDKIAKRMGRRRSCIGKIIKAYSNTNNFVRKLGSGRPRSTARPQKPKKRTSTPKSEAEVRSIKDAKRQKIHVETASERIPRNGFFSGSNQRAKQNWTSRVLGFILREITTQVFVNTTPLAGTLSNCQEISWFWCWNWNKNGYNCFWCIFFPQFHKKWTRK